jgi:hypothetical protein
MTGETSDNSRDAMRALAQSVAEVSVGIVAMRDFLGRKVAREFMEEIGLAGNLDDIGDTALTDMLGVMATSGIVLSMRGDTSEEAIEREVDRLHAQMPAQLIPSVGRLTSLVIPRGISFHKEEMQNKTEKAESWISEFQLLTSMSA